MYNSVNIKPETIIIEEREHKNTAYQSLQEFKKVRFTFNLFNHIGLVFDHDFAIKGPTVIYHFTSFFLSCDP